MSKLTPQYIAGLFDGEGWISLRPQSQKRYLSSITIHIGIGMTNSIILKFHKKFGGYLNISPETEKHKKCYKWSLGTKKQIKKFLTIIYPYLIVKKEQAKIMLKFIDLKTVSRRKRNSYLVYRALKYINKIRYLNGRVKRNPISVKYGNKKYQLIGL